MKYGWAVLGLGLTVAVGQPGWAQGLDLFEQQLRRAVGAGELASARADLYRLLQLRNPAALADAGLRPRGGLIVAQRGGGGNGGLRERSGTLRLRALKARLAAAPAEIRAAAGDYLQPQRPAAVRAARGAGKEVEPFLPNALYTENFSVEWGSDLTNEDGTRPPRDSGSVLADDPAVAGNGVPDVVERWAAYLEASYGRVVEEMGFTHPDLDAYRVSVYIGNSDPGTKVDDISTTGLFGFTTTGANPVPHLVVNNNFFDLLFLRSLESIVPFMQVTAAHEFFHVIHFLYEAPLTRDDHAAWAADAWWWEATATWMEDEVFDSVDDYHAWFETPEDPWQPFVSDSWNDFVEWGLAPVRRDPDDVGYDEDRDPFYDFRAYGGVIFAKYLSEHVGGRDVVRAVWQRISASVAHPEGQRVLDALDEYAVAAGLDGLEQVLLGFAAANATMDYEEGAAYATVPVRAQELSVDSDRDGLPVPDTLGVTYLEESGGAPGGVRVALSGDATAGLARRWGLALAVARSEGYVVALGAADAVGAPVLELAALGGGDTIYAGIAFLDPVLDSFAYTCAATSVAPVDTSPPAAVTLRQAPQAVPGGFDLQWDPATDASGVAGYVVRWKRASDSDYVARTLFGPLIRVEVRGLGLAEYDVQVFAYDGVGNAAVPASAVQVEVVESAADAVPPADLIVEVIQSSGGGGGGGGGCFLSSVRPRGSPWRSACPPQ